MATICMVCKALISGTVGDGPVSHGLCPECFAAMLAELDAMDEKEEAA